MPDPFHAGPERSWTLICLAAALVIVGIEWARAGWPATDLDIPLAVYVAFALLTSITSVNRGQTLLWLISLAAQIGMFAATVSIARRVPRAAAAWIAAFAAAVFLNLLLATMYHADVGLLTRPKLYPSPEGWTGYPQLAALAVMQFAIALAGILCLRGAALLASAALLVVTLAELALLYARGGWLAAAVVLAIAPAALASWRHVRRLVIAAVIVGVLGAAAVTANPMLRRLALGDTTAPLNGYNLELATPEMRYALWRRTLHMIADHPFTGVGLGNFQQVFESVYNPELNNDQRRGVHAHNVWLQQFAELGIPGGLAYLVLTIAAWVLAWRAARATPRFVPLAVLLSMTALAASNLTTNLFFLPGLVSGRLHSLQWILFAFASAGVPQPREMAAPGTNDGQAVTTPAHRAHPAV